MVRPRSWHIVPDFMLGSLLATAGFARSKLTSIDTALMGEGPVLVAPGLLAPTMSVRPIVSYLQKLGYDAKSPDILFNMVPHKDEPLYGASFGDAVKQLADRHSLPVHLIGWSLGGFMARAYAQEHPKDVASVQMIASSFLDAKNSSVLSDISSFWSRFVDIAQLSDEMNERLAEPLLVPSQAYVAQCDGIVDNYLCGRDNAIWLPDTHVSIGFNPDVHRMLAQYIHQTNETFLK